MNPERTNIPPENLQTPKLTEAIAKTVIALLSSTPFDTLAKRLTGAYILEEKQLTDIYSGVTATTLKESMENNNPLALQLYEELIKQGHTPMEALKTVLNAGIEVSFELLARKFPVLEKPLSNLYPYVDWEQAEYTEEKDGIRYSAIETRRTVKEAKEAARRSVKKMIEEDRKKRK